MKLIRKVRMGLRSVVSACIMAAVICSAQAAQKSGLEERDSDRPDLTGTVKDPEGKPLPQASVFIYTAGPKEGASILCPSCYADCRKSTTTDKDGHFKIESLDP